MYIYAVGRAVTCTVIKTCWEVLGEIRNDLLFVLAVCWKVYQGVFLF